MIGLSLQLVVWAVVFASFRFYMQRHLVGFRGSSQGFGVFLGLVTLAITVYYYGFLAYLLVTEGWLVTLKLIAVVSALLMFVVIPLEALITSRLTKRGADVGPFTDLPGWLSVTGIVVTPVAAYCLYRIAAAGALLQ